MASGRFGLASIDGVVEASHFRLALSRSFIYWSGELATLVDALEVEK